MDYAISYPNERLKYIEKCDGDCQYNVSKTMTAIPICLTRMGCVRELNMMFFYLQKKHLIYRKISIIYDTKIRKYENKNQGQRHADDIVYRMKLCANVLLYYDRFFFCQ